MGGLDAPDTAHSAIVTDHPYYTTRPNLLCDYCNLSVAAHKDIWVGDNPPPLRPQRPEEIDHSGDSERLEKILPLLEDREEKLRTEGHKDDFDKTNWAVIPWLGAEEMAKVMTFGAEKYAAYNFRRGMKWSRLSSAAIRHIWAWICGQENDEESGLSHLAHAACCVLMLLDLQILQRGEDDRWRADEDRTDPTDA